MPGLQPVTTTAEVPNPFHRLTDKDIEIITSWLQDLERGLNLTNAASPDLSLTDNYICHMEELKPNKTDVWRTCKRVSRCFNMLLSSLRKGGKDESGGAKYSFGPLPLSPCSKFQCLNYFYNGVNGPHIGFDGRFTNSFFRAATDACVIKLSSTDAYLYKLRMIVWNNIVYKSVKDFREAYEGGSVNTLFRVPTDDPFLRKDRKGPFRDFENRMASAMIEPGGKRYKVDLKNKARRVPRLEVVHTAYIRRYYRIAAQMGKFVPGYGCPYQATYWDTEFTSGLSNMRINGSICILGFQ
ncbi:hypothetical protein S40288_11245 [Stachybotrys chartarum IBT 40288]|nr:hypothetical protein S40288_11245 [Stachybotrys chartarum IBT 40288]